jgi:hypothetical protein
MGNRAEKQTPPANVDPEKLQLKYWEHDFWNGYRRGVNRLRHGKLFGSDEEHRRWLEMPEDLEEGLSIEIVATDAGYRAGHAGLDVVEAVENIRELIRSLQEKYGMPKLPA